MHIRDIFIEAVQLEDAQARDAFLDKACEGDAELRRSVEELLAEQAVKVSHFLDYPAVGVATALHPTTSAVGAQIGPYKLREQLGEGGMGVVYVAEQTEPVKRKVALKIIKPGMASKDVVARFEAERQALAMMDHPNIAKVHDGGATDSGQPYFVMELVQGLPITEYCDEHKLSTDDRLKLFVTVCRAVQHAHQKGIIHRDLKPSNIIVSEIDDAAVPKVIDFGVAKAVSQTLTDETLYTHFSQIVGTPLYMSPEQTGLGVVDIDTRSDVYALGVLLYELLTGRTPFDSDTLKSAGFDEMRRIIREDEPPKPSAMVSTLKADAMSTISQRRGSDPRKLSDALQGELDWLVMKALEKDRNRRYESASALAADIERYLNDEPVEACPPSLSYRFQKLAGKHKALLTTAAIVAASLVVGTGVATWQALRASKALTRASESEQLADEERVRALESFRRAEDALESLLSRVQRDSLLQSPELHGLRSDLLGVARDYYSSFVEEYRDIPPLKADLAEAYLRLGEIAWLLGDREMGRDAHLQAVATMRDLVAANPNSEDLQHLLATTLLSVGQIPRDVQAGYLREAVEAAQSLTKPAHLFTLAQAQLQLGKVLQGDFVSNTGDLAQRDEAARAADQAEQLFRRLSEEESQSIDFQLGLAGALALQAWRNSAAGDYAKGAEYRQASLQLLEQLTAQHSDDAEIRKQLADGYAAAGESIKALKLYGELSAAAPFVVEYLEPQIKLHRAAANAAAEPVERLSHLQSAVDMSQRLADRYPDNNEYRGQLGISLQAQGSAWHEIASTAEAIDALKAAIAALTSVKPYLIGHLEAAYAELSKVQEQVGDVHAAIVSIEQALEINRQIRPRVPNSLGFVTSGGQHHLHLGSLRRQLGQMEEALAEARAAVELLEQAANEGVSNSRGSDILYLKMAQRDSYWEEGRHLQRLGQLTEAAVSYRHAIVAELDALRSKPVVMLHNCPNRIYDAWFHANRAAGVSVDVESVLRADLLAWQGIPNGAFPLRELELHLRLAEWLAERNRHDEAAESYASAKEMLATLLDREKSADRALAVAVCLHVCQAEAATSAPESELRSQILAAAFAHLQPALDLARERTRQEPRDKQGWKWTTWAELSLAHYQTTEWQGAEQEARVAIELAAGLLDQLEQFAPLLLLAGTTDEYRSLCLALLKDSHNRHGDSLAKPLSLCLLDPTPSEPQDFLQAAQRAAQESGDQHLVHVALYRNGRFAEAVEGLKADLEAHTRPQALIALHLAIANRLAGNEREAQSWLERAASDRNGCWQLIDKVTYAVLRRQAMTSPSTSTPETLIRQSRAAGQAVVELESP